jgi:hypothetical protein
MSRNQLEGKYCGNSHGKHVRAKPERMVTKVCSNYANKILRERIGRNRFKINRAAEIAKMFSRIHESNQWTVENALKGCAHVLTNNA